MRLIRQSQELSGVVVPKATGLSIPVKGSIDQQQNFVLNEYDQGENPAVGVTPRIVVKE